MFGTGLNYVAIRLLGVDKDHPVCVKARAKLHQLGMLRVFKAIITNLPFSRRWLHFHTCMGQVLVVYSQLL